MLNATSATAVQSPMQEESHARCEVHPVADLRAYSRVNVTSRLKKHVLYNADCG
jgi:hypothetical protein